MKLNESNQIKSDQIEPNNLPLVSSVAIAQLIVQLSIL